MLSVVMHGKDDALGCRADMHLTVDVESIDGFQGFNPSLAGHRFSLLNDVRVTSYIWHIFPFLASSIDTIRPQTAEKAVFPHLEKGYTPAPYCAYLSSVYKG
jgi:hypothetical protein